MKGGERVEKKTSEARRRANAKYDSEHTRQYRLKLNINTDADVIQKFDETKNVQGYIKKLVRDDIKAHE